MQGNLLQDRETGHGVHVDTTGAPSPTGSSLWTLRRTETTSAESSIPHAPQTAETPHVVNGASFPPSFLRPQTFHSPLSFEHVWVLLSGVWKSL